MKAGTAIDRLLIIWKSDLSDKMKRSFLPSSGHIDTAIWMHYLDAKWLAKKTDGNYTKMLRASTIRPLASYHENYLHIIKWFQLLLFNISDSIYLYMDAYFQPCWEDLALEVTVSSLKSMDVICKTHSG